MNENITTPRRNADINYVEPNAALPLKRISWSAIFAGVIISIIIYMLLAILGTAIGASSVDPLKEHNPADGLAMGAAIWTGASMLISIAVGAYASGRLAQREGALHGLLMFGVNTLICTFFIIVVINSAVTGAMNIAGAGLQTLGNGISAVSPTIANMAKDKLQENNINLDDLKGELETTLRQTGKPELQPENLENKAQNESDVAQNRAEDTATHPQTADNDLTSWVQGVINRNDDTLQAADKEALKNIIQARTGKSDAEADQIVNQTEQSYQQAKAKYEQLKADAEQKAREAADKAAAATAKASWFTFFMLIVEAVLAGVMGMVGRRTQPRPVAGERYDI